MSNGGTKGLVLQVVLFASLAINVFIAGFFAAHLLRHPRPQPLPAGPMTVIERLSNRSRPRTRKRSSPRGRPIRPRCRA